MQIITIFYNCVENVGKVKLQTIVIMLTVNVAALLHYKRMFIDGLMDVHLQVVNF